MLDKLRLNKEATTHLYIQLYHQIKTMITAARLEAHDKLPAIRKLADSLEINNVTVVKAYDLLAEEELIYKKIGSGTFVAAQLDLSNTPDFALDTATYIDEDSKFNQSEGMINFATAAPDPELFPIGPFKRLLNKVLDRDKGYAFGYQKSQGYLPLRKSIAQYVKEQGIDTTAEHIQIVSGAQQGIDILSKALLDYKDVVFTESPSYPGAISVFKSRRAEIVGIKLEEDGLNLKQLEERLKKIRPKFLYVMSAFQNPTGYSYSKAKKERILELAQEYDFLIIEDDCLGDLSYQPKRLLSFKQLDQNERVIYIKSFSKMLMPGLRLAFLVIPESYRNQILLSKYISDIFTDGLMQRVLDLYFKEEIWIEQVDKLKEIYQQRYNQMLKALNTYFPSEINYSKPKGGLNFWLKLPDYLAEERVYDRALGAGIKLAAGKYFYSQEVRKNRIRISIAAVNNSEIEQGVKKLAEIINRLLKESEVENSGQIIF